jgi:hypothetical protein
VAEFAELEEAVIEGRVAQIGPTERAVVEPQLVELEDAQIERVERVAREPRMSMRRRQSLAHSGIRGHRRRTNTRNFFYLKNNYM